VVVVPLTSVEHERRRRGSADGVDDVSAPAFREVRH
jgi:hypothetical protein